MNPKDFIAKNKHTYNAIAGHFSNTRTYLWDDLQLPEFTDHVQAGIKILDVGCGNGRLYQLFAEKKVTYVGLDQSEALIEIAQKKFPDAKFVVGEMTSLPFPDASFDVVYCIAAFHHLPDDATRLQALREMKRVLKSGGKVLMLNWNLQSDWAKKKYHVPDDGDVMAPWKDEKGRVLGDRYYHGFTLEDLATLAKMSRLEILGQYFVKKGSRSDASQGENIVSSFSLPTHQ